MNLGDRMNFDNLIIGQTPRTSNESQNFIINEPMDHRNLSFIEPKEPWELYNPINQANPRNLDILDSDPSYMHFATLFCYFWRMGLIYIEFDQLCFTLCSMRVKTNYSM